jgi:[protein-PII] uridylyltransferase
VTPDKPLVRARLSPVGEGLQVLVYAPDRPGLFARITGFFERMQFDVASAKIYTTRHGWALDNFQVLTRVRAGEHHRDLIHRIESGLAERIASAAPPEAPPPGRVSRWVKHFPIEPRVEVLPDRRVGRYLVSLSCADRPGLLSAIARVFLQHGLNLADARVTTLGARAEDTFVMDGPELEREESRTAVVRDLLATAAS